MTLSQLRARGRGFVHRNGARFFFRRPLAIRTETALISFTFDDFPRSALLTGGSILKHFGVAGTYYASLGIMGNQEPSGPMFLPQDLEFVLEQGHELGCHTFGHCHSGLTDARIFEESIIANQGALGALCPGTSFRTFSYPISAPRMSTKRRAAKYFPCSRGGGQTFNTGIADLNYLSAYFLEKSRSDFQKIKEVIEQNRLAKGWLIFATHDICDWPTQVGCTPNFFKDVVRCTIASGARILPVFEALQTLLTLPERTEPL